MNKVTKLEFFVKVLTNNNISKEIVEIIEKEIFPLANGKESEIKVEIIEDFCGLEIISGINCWFEDYDCESGIVFVLTKDLKIVYDYYDYNLPESILKDINFINIMDIL